MPTRPTRPPRSAAIVLLLAGIAWGCLPAGEERPNILLILSDDHAQQAISAYGSELIETPNIDRIAAAGIRFANSFVTNSICAPSRAVILTGKYSHRNGLRDNRDLFDGSQVTFPKLLQQAGYQTAVVGKWHLKTEPTGFDDWRVLTDQGRYYSPVFNLNGETVRRTGYATDLITDMAIEFLEGRDRERPFALLYHHKAPHRPWMPATRHLGLYAERDLPLPETFDDDYRGRPAAAAQDMRVADMWLSLDMKLHPESFGEETGSGGKADFDPIGSWQDGYQRMTPDQRALWDEHYGPLNQAFREAPPSGDALTAWKYQRYIKDYLRTVAALDEGIGRVLDTLDRQGLADNTLVVYTSDQGFYLGEHGWYDKRFMYEESLRTPLVMRHPASIPAGRVAEELVLNLDLAPTLLELAGVPVPAEMQGRSLLPLARGTSAGAWRDAFYYRYYEFPHGWHLVRPHYGVRTQRHKLIHFTGDMDHWELYDLATDPHELNNRYGDAEYGEVQRLLHARLAALRDQVGDLEAAH